MEEKRNAYKVFVRKRKTPRKHGRRWANNIKMGLKRIGYEGVDWIHQV
jgi:hypothetical protein